MIEGTGPVWSAAARLTGTTAPLYPFGRGVSFTTASYDDLAPSSPDLSSDGSIEATVPVRNTGRRTVEEVVQLGEVCSARLPRADLLLSARLEITGRPRVVGHRVMVTPARSG